MWEYDIWARDHMIYNVYREILHVNDAMASGPPALADNFASSGFADYIIPPLILPPTSRSSLSSALMSHETLILRQTGDVWERECLQQRMRWRSAWGMS